jgi:hypothetical protein
MFRDKLSVSSSRVKKEDSLPLKTICCPETLVNNYNYSLRDSLARTVLMNFAAEARNLASSFVCKVLFVYFKLNEL